VKYHATGFGVSAIAPSKAIDQARFEAVNRSKNVCLLALGFEEKFQLFLDNFQEWETELLNQAQSFLLWRVIAHADAMGQRLGLDRRLVNLLTSLRLYLDQTDYGLSRMFGNPSGELDAIKNFKSSLYDSHFGYRLLEALRNHVQHCSLPVSEIVFKHDRQETKEGPHIQVSVMPQLSFNTFRTGEGFKKCSS
jgi:hypothetical protein